MLRKQCRHVKAGDDPKACMCAWYAVLRLQGKTRWINLGPSPGPARDEYKRLVRQVEKDKGHTLLAARGMHTVEQVTRAFRDAEGTEEAQLSPQTLAAFTVRGNAFMRYFGKESPMATIATDDIIEWRRALRVEVSQNYEREVIAYARRMFDFALREGHITDNPWPDSWPRMPRRAPRRRKPRHHPLDRMRATVTQVRQPYGDACELMLLTGLRAGELLALTPDDVLWEHGEPVALEVQANFDLVERKRAERVKTSDAFRTVDLSPRAAEIVKARSTTGRMWPYVHHTLNKWWQKAQREAGLDPVLGLHSLRHAHRTLCEVAGMDDRLIAYRLGHGDRTEWSRGAYGTGRHQAKQGELIKLDA